MMLLVKSVEDEEMNGDKIHPCCERCAFACKKFEDAEWSNNVDCNEFCKYFEETDALNGQRSKRWKKMKH